MIDTTKNISNKHKQIVILEKKQQEKNNVIQHQSGNQRAAKRIQEELHKLSNGYNV